MTAQRDPAGLDELLLAAGRGVTRFAEFHLSAKLGRPVQLWEGKDGLGAMLKEEIERAGVPNKRLPDLLTPRAVIGTVRKKRVVRRRAKR